MSEQSVIIPYTPKFKGKVNLDFEWGKSLLLKEASTKQQLKQIKMLTKKLLMRIPKKYVLIAENTDFSQEGIRLDFFQSNEYSQEKKNRILSAFFFMQWEKSIDIAINIIDRANALAAKISNANQDIDSSVLLKKLKQQADELFYGTTNQILSYSNMPENAELGLLSKEFAILIAEPMPITEQVETALNEKIAQLSENEKEVGQSFVIPFEDYFLKCTFTEKGNEVGFFQDKACTVARMLQYYK